MSEQRLTSEPVQEVIPIDAEVVSEEPARSEGKPAAAIAAIVPRKRVSEAEIRAVLKLVIERGLEEAHRERLSKHLAESLILLPDGNQKKSLALDVVRYTWRFRERQAQIQTLTEEIGACDRGSRLVLQELTALRQQYADLLQREVNEIMALAPQGQPIYAQEQHGDSGALLKFRIEALTNAASGLAERRVNLSLQREEAEVELLAETGLVYVSIGKFGDWITSELASDAALFQGGSMGIDTSQGYSGQMLRDGRALLARHAEQHRELDARRTNMARALADLERRQTLAGRG